MSIKNSDHVVCASKVNEKYLSDLTDKITYISYGASTEDVKEIDKTTVNLMERYDIKNHLFFDNYVIIFPSLSIFRNRPLLSFTVATPL